MVHVKTYLDRQIEQTNADSLKQKVVQTEDYTQPAVAISDCTTELFTLFGCSVRKYHLDIIMIGLQMMILLTLLKK